MVDVISQNESAEFEDGELPEDGEICDDEDEVPAPSKLSQPEPQPQSSSSEVSNSSGSHRDRGERGDRERERDRERVRDRDSRRSRRSDDQPTVRDLDPFGPGSDDGHHQMAETYGNGTGDKDYRSMEEEYNDVDYRVTRRRRHSPQNEEIDSRAKRPPPYYNSRPASYRGGLHGPGANPRYATHQKPAGGPPRFNTEKQICKFFREGYCRDGDNCSYSHNTEDSLRRPILCNFYASSFCKKGLQCLMLHGEYPCKEFHQNGCQNDQCRYSHLPLTEYTKPLFEASLQEDHPMSQYQAPPKHHHHHHQRAHPVAPPPPIAQQPPAMLPAPMPSRRKVLLPGGPANLSPPHQIHAAIPQSMNGGQLPPPAVVVPTRGAGYPSTGYFNQGPQPLMGAGALPPVRNIEPPRPVIQPVMPMNVMQGQAAVPALEKPATTPVQPAFNIEAMLNKLAKGGDLSEDESPASPPPPLFPLTTATNITPIPSMEVREAPWRLVRVNRQPAYCGVENIDQIASNDPRKARCISAQFDAISNIFGGAPIGGDPRLSAAAAVANSSSTKKLSPVITSSWMPQMS